MEELIQEIESLKFAIKRAGHQDHILTMENLEFELEQVEERLLKLYGITFEEWELKN